MNWLVVAIVLLVAFQAGQFIGFFRGWKFGLLHPPKTMIYFTPMFSVRLREWGLQVRLTSRKVFRIGTVTESKDSRWETSQTEVYYPNRGRDRVFLSIASSRAIASRASCVLMCEC